MRAAFGLFILFHTLTAAADVKPGPRPLLLEVGPFTVQAGPTTATVRLEAEAAPTLEVMFPGGPPQKPKPEATQVAHGTRTLYSYTATDLSPGREYTYEVVDTQGRRTQGHFRTAPQESTPFGFLIYGDNRTDDAAHAAVAQRMAAAPGEFLLNTGDLVEEGSKREDWLGFFRIEKALLQARAVFSTVGNHELYQNGGVEYAQYFGDPSALQQKPVFFNSTFRWGSARFFLLNSMTSFRGTKDRAWLDDALEKAKNETGVRFRFIVMHHGLYSSGPHGNNTRMIDVGLPDVFRKYEIDAIFAGHDHIYERGTEDGLRYIVSGGGGAPSYEIRKPRPGMKKAEPVRHYIEARIDGDMFSMTVRRETGAELESCGFKKGTPGWLCDPALPPTVPVPTPTPPPKSGCSCTQGAETGNGWILGVLVTLAVLGARKQTTLPRM